MSLKLEYQEKSTPPVAMKNWSEAKYKGYTIKIIPDDNAESPDEWGNEDVFLVGYHRDFSVERNEIVTEGQCWAIFTRNPDEDEKEVVDALRKQYHVFGLEAYIHSGV